MDTKTTMFMAVSSRYTYLDYLRGWAALVVMIGHIFMLFIETENNPNWSLAQTLPTRLLFTTHGSVIVFFALSGFALYSLFESSQKKYSKFLPSRWLRIFPTYFLSIVISLFLMFIYRETNIWPREWTDFNPIAFLQHILLIGPIDFRAYNGPIWSLVHEMRLSIVFPLIYYAAQRKPVATLLIPTFVSTTLGIFYFNELYTRTHSQLSNIQHTVHYITLFAYGAVIARYRQSLTSTFQTWTTASRVIALSILLMAYTYTPYSKSIGASMLIDILIGVISGGFITFAISVKQTRRIASLEFLGKISFSLYVIHIPILLGIRSFLYGSIPYYLLFILYLALPVLAATLLYEVIEKPSLRWSRKVRS
jgi:peptidoglycan/LPS O-acetylase OafA/YrhL